MPRGSSSETNGRVLIVMRRVRPCASLAVKRTAAFSALTNAIFRMGVANGLDAALERTLHAAMTFADRIQPGGGVDGGEGRAQRIANGVGHAFRIDPRVMD